GDIFDQMETFANYGFNKSHAAAYALISFQTAYLKAHFPEEFVAALMTLEMDDADKTHKNIAEARDRKIPVLPPDVNESRDDFTLVEGKIRFGLGAIKGVGAKASEAILLERDAGGAYVGLDDLVRRVRSAHVNRRVLESLVKCGGFDSSGASRAALLHRLHGVPRWAAAAFESAHPDHPFGAMDGGAPRRYTLPPTSPSGEK